MSESNFKSTMEALFHGMDNVISSKTVVGEAIHIKRYDHPPACGRVFFRRGRIVYRREK